MAWFVLGYVLGVGTCWAVYVTWLWAPWRQKEER